MDAFVTEILVPGALRSSLALGAAALAAGLARRASATTRHRLWALGLLAALVLPVLGPLSPRLARVPLPAVVPAPAAAPVISLPAVEPPAAAPAVAAPAAATVTRSPRWTVATLLGTIWLAGALLVIAARAFGLGARWRLQRAARPVTDPSWTETLAELSRELGLRRPVTLLASAQAAVPMTWGTRRPILLLPTAALRWPRDQRRAVALHELAHVRRRDAAWGALAHGACAFHWPNPLVWLAARRLRAEAEFAADDRVLTRGLRPSLYAGHLLAVARALAQGPPPPRPVVAMALSEGSSSLSRRIGAILDGGRPRGEGRGGARLAAVALAAVVTLGLAATGCIEVDGLEYSMNSSDTTRSASPRGYFAQERFAGHCPPGLMSGRGQGIRVRGHRSGRHEIDLRQASCRLEIEVEGPVAVDDAGRVELGPGAMLNVRETSGLGERALFAGAGPVLAYRVDGAERPVDDEARALLARAVLEVQRSTTLGAEERVARLLASGGSAAVLAEIGEISADYLRAVYLRELLEQSRPRGAELSAVLTAATRLVESDYERSQILQSLAENAEPGESLPAEFFTAAAALGSDYERSQTLQKVLERPTLTELEVTRTLEVARGLDSDYERSQTLQRTLDRAGLPEAAVLEVLRSVETVESDYEAGQVLARLIAKRPLFPAEIDGVIAATRRIESGYDRAQVLIALVRGNRLDGATLDRYVAAAEGIDSEYDRDRALAAALRPRNG